MKHIDSNLYIVFPSAKILDLSGQIVICRGPLVYCAEGVDNKNEFIGLHILKNPFDIKIQISSNEITILLVPGVRQGYTEDLYTYILPKNQII